MSIESAAGLGAGGGSPSPPPPMSMASGSGPSSIESGRSCFWAGMVAELVWAGSVAELVWAGMVAELERAAITSGSLSSARDTSSTLRSQSRLMAMTCALRLTTTWFFSINMPPASTRSTR